MRKLLFAILAWGIAGCASADPSAPTPRDAPAGADDFEAAPPSRGPVIGGERIARVVSWPARDELDAELVAALDGELRAAIDVAPLPVLLPSEVPLAGARLMHGEHWWALWVQHDGITLTLQASGVAKVHADLRGAKNPHTVRGVEGLVTQNESLWSAAWVEHGVAYALGLECADPQMEACRDDGRVREIAEGLVFAGGRR
jgi:hypothetical protein